MNNLGGTKHKNGFEKSKHFLSTLKSFSSDTLQSMKRQKMTERNQRETYTQLQIEIGQSEKQTLDGIVFIQPISVA